MSRNVLLITNTHGAQYEFCRRMFVENPEFNLFHCYFETKHPENLFIRLKRFLIYLKTGYGTDVTLNVLSRICLDNIFRKKQSSIDRLFGISVDFENSIRIETEKQICKEVLAREISLIVVCGAPVLRLVPKLSVPAINLHIGITPKYRGLKCIEEAILRDDLGNIGFTIHLLTDQLDGGAIIYQETIDTTTIPTLAEIYFRLYTRGIKRLVQVATDFNELNWPSKSLVQPTTGSSKKQILRSIMFNRFKMRAVRKKIPITGEILWIATNPVQYHVPIYQYLSSLRLLTVFFLSDIGHRPFLSEEQGGVISWDVDLVSGFESCFVKNLAPDHWKGPFSRISFDTFNKIRKSSAEIVVINGYSLVFNWLYILCSKICGKKVYLRGETIKDEVKLSLKVLSWFLDGVCYSCELNKQALMAKFPQKKRIFIPSTVDSNFFTPNRNIFKQCSVKELRFLVISRLTKRKNIKSSMDFVEFFSRYTGTNAVLTVCGDGPEKTELQLYAQQLGIECKFNGFVGQLGVREALQSNDVYLNQAFYDASPKALNEALASGLICIINKFIGQSGDLAGCDGCLIVQSEDWQPPLSHFYDRILSGQKIKMHEASFEYSKKFDVGNIDLEGLI